MMQSPQMPYRTALSACAAFFAGPGIFYGMLTSRMPALKAQAGVSEGEIGFLLLSLGLSALVMLLMSSLLVTKFGSRRVLGWGSLVCMAGIPVAAFAADFWVLWGAFILFGFGMGLWDVSMNVQGMGVERRYGKSSMLILHASYSTGSVIGAASGAFFAAAELAVVPHFLTVFVVYLAVRAWAKTKLYEDQPAGGAAKESGSIFGLPLIVYVFGLMAACAYASEGSAAEWGSLLLHSVKGADEDIAALAFAAFSSATVACRLSGEPVRQKLGDFRMAFFGALIATFAAAVVHFTESPYLCLAAYALLGAGLSPIVPLLFSRAGSLSSVSPAAASALISVLAYGGMLMVPPTLGILAEDYGLNNALLLVPFLCGLIALGSLVLRIR